MAVARRTAAADDDLRSMAFAIGIESGRLGVAERIVDELLDRCDRLAQQSHLARIGSPAPQLGSDVRLVSHRRWVIIFRYDDDGIVVLRIADGSQDYLAWHLVD